MAYNPQVTPLPLGGQTPMAGQYYAQGIQNAGNSVAQGLDRWFQNDRQDTQTRAQVAGLLPFAGDDLKNPEDQKLLEKFLNHKTDYKDNGYLLGILTTVRSAKEDKMKQDAFNVQLQAAQAQARERARQEEFGRNLDMRNANPNIFRKPSPYMQTAMDVRQATGQTLTADELAKNVIAKEIAGASRPPGSYQHIDQVNAQGQTIRYTVDANGNVLGSAPAPRAYASPEEQAQTAGLTANATQAATRASDYVTGVSDAAEHAQQSLAEMEQIEKLLTSGAATSGWGQSLLTSAGSIATRAGLKDRKAQANQEQLEKMFAQRGLEVAQALMKGGGSVSNYERQLVKDAMADGGKTSETNLRIIRYAIALARRSQEMEVERQRLYDEKATVPEMAEQLKRWSMKHQTRDYMSAVGLGNDEDAPAPETAQTAKLPPGFKRVP